MDPGQDRSETLFQAGRLVSSAPALAVGVSTHHITAPAAVISAARAGDSRLGFHMKLWTIWSIRDKARIPIAACDHGAALMPREARVVAVGVPHHSTKRGNNRQYIFVAGEDRRQYLVALAQDSARCRIGLLGWCLMTHHVHLAGVPERPDAFARGLQRCHSRWAQRFHRQYPRSGHLWQGRFFSCALDRDHLTTALAYVDLHPVRAGRLGDAPAHPWSSAVAQAASRDSRGLLDLEEPRRTLGRQISGHERWRTC